MLTKGFLRPDVSAEQATKIKHWKKQNCESKKGIAALCNSKHKKNCLPVSQDLTAAPNWDDPRYAIGYFDAVNVHLSRFVQVD
jgi:hypothetical protein